MLFDLVKPGEVLGKLSCDAVSAIGLWQGLPVIIAHDKAVEALAREHLRSKALIFHGTHIGAMVEVPIVMCSYSLLPTYLVSRPAAIR